MHSNFKLALITGASSGIGEALSRLLAHQGISLILTGRDRGKLNELQEELSQLVSVKCVVADLADVKPREELLAVVRELKPDLIINNAGFGLYGEAIKHDTVAQRKILDVNATALLELTLDGARTLVSAGKQGVILNISSSASALVFPNFSVYAASKAFVTQFSLAMDEELRPHGVRVLVALPGMVKTNFGKRASGSHRESKKNWYSMDTEYVAKLLWRQIQKRKGAIIFDWKTHLGVFLLTHLLPRRLAARILSSSLPK